MINNKLLELSKKAKVPINLMANYCISQYFPEPVKKLTNKHNDLYRMTLLDKRLANRTMLFNLENIFNIILILIIYLILFLYLLLNM